METTRSAAEILVEGELSPFEHEALYRLLRKHFQLEQPNYSENLDETVGTRVNLTFHHSYNLEFFTGIFRDDWRNLRDLFKQISYRRGRLGASFTLTFQVENSQLSFSTGVLSDYQLHSAMDQIGYLTSIVGQMMSPERVVEPLGQVMVSFDKRTDRWQGFRGFGLADKKEYVFDETLYRWKTG